MARKLHLTLQESAAGASTECWNLALERATLNVFVTFLKPYKPIPHHPARRTLSSPLGRALSRLAILLITYSPLCVRAQQKPAAPLSVPTAAQPGSVSGTVIDPDGASIPGATVTLSGDALQSTRTAVTDKEGWFSFNGVQPGHFKIDVRAAGFVATQTTGSLGWAEQQALPEIQLAMEGMNSAVEVSLSPYQVSEVEVKAEETQHVGYVLPNFFITYDWNAPPLTTKQKYELALRSTIDPGGNIVNAASAGVYQAFNVLPGYRQGAAGYFKRLAAINANVDLGTFLGGAVLPSLLHQDPRYFYMGTEHGSVRGRALYALKMSVLCRGDNGKMQFSYSGIVADMAAGAAANLYYPAGSRDGATLTVENGLLSIVSDAAANLFQEFVVRRLTPHAPPPR